jgi:hypothetical protein
MPEIKLPPEVVAAFDALEAGQAIDLVNTFKREDGVLCATIKVRGSQPTPILELLDECKTDDGALCLTRQNPTLFRRRIQAINETVDKIKAILLPPISMNWQPISTAPTDGTQLLLCWPTLCREPLLAVGAFNGQWEPDESRFTGKQLRENPPTHWCPLPPPAITKDKA